MFQKADCFQLGPAELNPLKHMAHLESLALDGVAQVTDETLAKVSEQAAVAVHRKRHYRQKIAFVRCLEYYSAIGKINTALSESSVRRCHGSQGCIWGVTRTEV